MPRKPATAIFILGVVAAWPASSAIALAQAIDAPVASPVPSLAPMLEHVAPAVVSVRVKGRIAVQQNPMLSDPFFRQFFDRPDRQVPTEQEFQAAGSGVIIDAQRGIVITNNHVVENADEISLTFSNGKEVAAKQIGNDPQTDIAVLSVPADGLTGIAFGDSDSLRAGDYVVAVGNPFGLSGSVTSGIVSAIGRTGLGIERYENFIQTDASINPGNSGGALVDLNGNLVGINTAIVGSSGGSVGIGFAIPVNMVRDVAQQIISSGHVNRGHLGVLTQDLTPDIASALGTSATVGAVIASVDPGSAAESAGLRAGDIVAKVDGKNILSANDLSTRIGLRRPGDVVTLDILRDNKAMSITATLETETLKPVVAPASSLLDGATLVPSESGQGVIVDAVAEGSKAASAGLNRGDRILAVNRQRVTTPQELASVAQNASTLALEIQRGDTVMLIFIS
jgi:Do/DeqQ family serine protease